MLNISKKELEEIKSLLEKKLPSYRKAYSDRTSWLMAYISELAYIKFNPILKDSTKKRLIDEVSKLTEGKNINALNALIEMVGYDADENKKELEKDVQFLGLELVETFDNNGTQAILLENDTYLFLGFRGTEVTSIKDIQSDCKATTKVCESGGKIHSGFDEAFSQIDVDVQQLLDKVEYKDKPLFITGHSLGGALATIAAKKLTHKGGIAACYTFGSPRVGNISWALGIKTPIYRIVNAIDPVTMLPPSGPTIEITAKILGFIPVVGAKIKEALLSKLGGYYHCGNMRYLSVCEAGNYDNVKLLYSVSFIFRARAFFKNNMTGGAIPADHSIPTYKNKLKVIASDRNKNT